MWLYAQSLKILIIFFQTWEHEVEHLFPSQNVFIYYENMTERRE